MVRIPARAGRPGITSLLLLLLAPGLLAAQPGERVRLSSPDGHNEVVVEIRDGALTYSVSRRGRLILTPSRLGFDFRGAPSLRDSLRITGTERKSVDETWSQPWGEVARVRDHHNEVKVAVTEGRAPARRFSVTFRAFDDGVAFRYDLPEQEALRDFTIMEELTEFAMASDARAWWIPSFRPNRYEYLYETTPLADVHLAHTPMTVRLANGTHLSFHEAALVDYAAYVLDHRRPGTLRTSLTPWSDGARVRTRTPFRTPWRTVQVSANAAALMDSSLILNLNEPNVLGDVSWVEPGKYLGVWWAMHVKRKTWEPGPQHGATTAETMRYIDFAAEHGFAGVLVEGWNLGWDKDWYASGGREFDFTKPYPDFDLAAIADHARRKGVRLIGHHETAGNIAVYEPQMREAFALYAKHGVRQVKTGYVADAGDVRRIDERGVEQHEWHDGQFQVGHHLRVLQEAARHRISINAHEPVKATGLRRTYPNWLSREGARGQEYNAWGDPVNPPEHVAILPYTRMLAGPFDYTPGIVDLDGYDPKHRVQHTLAKELSLYVVLYAPVQMAADLPENYLKRPEAFQFIKDVPTDWDESIGLAGEVGDYVAIARRQRGTPDWYVGALTDEHARRLSLRLDFLDRDRAYEAEIWRDGPDADWETRPYDLVVERRRVRAGDTLELALARSGGAAIRIRPAAAETTR